MASLQSVSVEVTLGEPPSDVSARDLVMAWAVDRDTNQPRYIGQLDEDHRGAKCNCRCPSCNLDLTAVNAAKTEYLRRPHFRHPEGAAREKCIIIAARRALEQMFAEQQRVVLPRRSRPGSVEGLSGKYFNAWVHRPAESADVVGCSFEDETRAVLTLDDGRRLVVGLLGRGEVVRQEDNATLLAGIEIRVDDPAIAMMSPEDIMARLELAWSNACWTRHWEDAKLDSEATAMSRELAADALDWLNDDPTTETLSPSERRETLLHREVKAILERERRIRVPGLFAEPTWRHADGFVASMKWSHPDEELVLTSVELEVHLGHSVPDVVATWVGNGGQNHSMLIEVTVTNRMTEERIDRLSSFGCPVLEIDISRMGGVVTREEFSQLVVDEVAGKRWLYHPRLVEEKARLIGLMQQGESAATAARRDRSAFLSVTADEWGRRYLIAVQKRWTEDQRRAETGIQRTYFEQRAQDEIVLAKKALDAHGYPGSDLDRDPLKTIVARILSIQLDTGIEYKFNTGWQVINAIQMDQARARHWHSLYLIAVRVYSPALTDYQRRWIDAWRNTVVASINKEERAFVRDVKYDRLLGVLFQDMQAGLSKPFGTPHYVHSKRPVASDAMVSGTGFDESDVKGIPPTESALRFASYSPRELIDYELLLERSGAAAGSGIPPTEFARRFAMEHPRYSARELVDYLLFSGVAKSDWYWS